MIKSTRQLTQFSVAGGLPLANRRMFKHFIVEMTFYFANTSQ